MDGLRFWRLVEWARGVASIADAPAGLTTLGDRYGLWRGRLDRLLESGALLRGRVRAGPGRL